MSTAASAPVVVRRRDTVKIVMKTGAVSIEAEGRALSDARQGEKLRVRRSSGGVFVARAVAPGLVEVGEGGS